MKINAVFVDADRMTYPHPAWICNTLSLVGNLSWGRPQFAVAVQVQAGSNGHVEYFAHAATDGAVGCHPFGVVDALAHGRVFEPEFTGGRPVYRGPANHRMLAWLVGEAVGKGATYPPSPP